MASSVARSGRSMPLNSLDRRPAKASIAINSPEITGADVVRGEAVSLVFEAIAAIGMSEKEAAYTMAIDPATLSRVKSQQARLSIDALFRMPDRFWFAFWDRLRDARGLSRERERAQRAERIGELVRLLIEIEGAA